MPLSRRSFDSFLGSVISESSSVLHSVFVRLYAKPRFGGAGGTAAFGFESLLSGAETGTVQPLGGSGGAGSGPGSLQELLRLP